MWRAHRLVFELLSPLHVGWRKLGNLQATRRYVPARAVWGALTARIVRDAGGCNYDAVGTAVNSELAFTYLYPSARPDGVETWPWQIDEFDWRFLGSYAGTALTDGRKAEEGMLHETEYIASRTRDGGPVFLIGYIFVHENSTLRWCEALRRLQFGGERSYGWGRVRTIAVEHEEVLTAYPELVWQLEGRRPTATVAQNGRLLAHARGKGIACQGMVEPLLGRVTSTSSGAFGEYPSEAVVCWEPGSTLESTCTFEIGPFGIWEAISP